MGNPNGISDAAMTYATSRYPRSLANNLWQVATDAYDAALAATRRPERLTDPDDPRIKDDATYELRENRPQSARGIRKCLMEGCHEVYLPAPAPDPRADLRAVLRQAIDDANVAAELSDTEADDIINGLIDRNYDLTKRGE